VIVLVMGLAS